MRGDTRTPTRPTTAVRVRYPLAEGSIALRLDSDWDRDVEAVALEDGAATTTFQLRLSRPYAYFKPVLRRDGQEVRWAAGNDYLLVAGADRTIYPSFWAESICTPCDVREVSGEGGAPPISYRVFQPPGYGENVLKRYPVVYIQDGQNLFFPEESAFGKAWRIGETLEWLAAMNAIDKVLIVGLVPQDRQRDYTAPGYQSYGETLVQRVLPEVESDWRALRGPENTAVMGSSLGGVVSFFLAWNWPETFGMTACMSSTFGWRDDLRSRIASEPQRDLRIYLDSGWPDDNYEVTRAMRDLLVQRGYGRRRDLMYLAFPQALHDERYWALRVPIPFQFFFRSGPLPGVSPGLLGFDGPERPTKG